MKLIKRAVFLILCLNTVCFVTTKVVAQDKYLTVTDPIPNRFIVVLSPDKFKEKSLAEVDQAAQSLASDYNGTVGFVYESVFQGFSVEMQEPDAIALSEHEDVRYVTQDNEMFLQQTQTNAPWNLDRID